jgi:hypothetical protein
MLGRSFSTNAVMLAIGLLVSSALFGVDASVPLHLQHKSRRVLQSASQCSGVGRVSHGLRCKKPGLECQQQQASCKGLWNAETKQCYDLRVTCTCDGKKWSCPQVRCVPPDSRCTKKARRCDKLGVAQGKKCHRPGLQCPWSSNPVTCGGGYNEETKQCEKGSVIEPPCTCTKEGTWSCVLPKCMQAAPDTRCPGDCTKFNVEPGEFCFGEGGTCPYRDFTCKDFYNEATGTCEDVTIHTQCDCYEGQFMCAIPSCAPPDERCGKKAIVDECWMENVSPGEKCKTPGLHCPDLDAMICKGMWDEDKQTCYDQHVTAPCTCDAATSTWTCGVHIMGCRAPDERCSCPSPEKINPGDKCSAPGAECPFSQGSTTCMGQWSEEKQGCYDATIETSCFCADGQWICAMASCAPPDERCLPKEEAVCPYGVKSAPIGHGLSCSSEGLTCSDFANQANCNGIFVPGKQVCYDKTVVPECKCKDSKWYCQPVEECPPFDPNCLNSCLYAGQGVKCSDPGLECPSSSQTVTCTDQWNEELQSCYDVTINPPCHCDGESWSCAAVKCAKPDPRCLKTQCPVAEEISPMGECSNEGEACPWIPMTCGGPTWNEDTQTCQTSTFTPSCFCSEKRWMCAIPMCAMPVPDARCSCDGQMVEHGELCFGEGGTCLSSMACLGMLQADGTCADSTVTNKCQCSGGTWDCDMKSACPAPDAKCVAVKKSG